MILNILCIVINYVRTSKIKSCVLFFIPFSASTNLDIMGGGMVHETTGEKKMKRFLFLESLLVKRRVWEVHRFSFCRRKFGVFLENFIDCDNFHYSYDMSFKDLFCGWKHFIFHKNEASSFVSYNICVERAESYYFMHSEYHPFELRIIVMLSDADDTKLTFTIKIIVY